MKKTAILVLGMHRSGTSALTGTLNLLDVYLGSELLKPNAANPKGFFENYNFYEVNEELLRQCESSWDDLFYNEEKLLHIKETDALRDVIKKEFAYSRVFAIKDPRMIYLFPVYKRVLEELEIDIKVILPFRNPLEVASSLHKRDSMSMEKGLLLWAYNFLLAEYYSRGTQRVFTDFDELVSDTRKVVYHISEGLGLDLKSKYEKNKEQIAKFLEPGLKHHNISLENLSEDVPLIVQKIISLQERFEDATTLEEFDLLRKELFDYQLLFYNEEIRHIVKELPKKEEELQQTKVLLEQKEERIAYLEGIVSQQKQHNEHLDRLIVEKERSVEHLNRVLKEKERHIQEKEKHIQNLDAILDKKEKHIQNLNDDLAGLISNNKKLDSELAVKEKEIDELKDEIVEIYTSKSWKITRPFRVLIRGLKKR